MIIEAKILIGQEGVRATAPVKGISCGKSREIPSVDWSRGKSTHLQAGRFGVVRIRQFPSDKIC